MEKKKKTKATGNKTKYRHPPQARALNTCRVEWDEDNVLKAIAKLALNDKDLDTLYHRVMDTESWGYLERKSSEGLVHLRPHRHFATIRLYGRVEGDTIKILKGLPKGAQSDKFKKKARKGERWTKKLKENHDDDDDGTGGEEEEGPTGGEKEEVADGDRAAVDTHEAADNMVATAAATEPNVAPPAAVASDWYQDLDTQIPLQNQGPPSEEDFL